MYWTVDYAAGSLRPFGAAIVDASPALARARVLAEYTSHLPADAPAAAEDYDVLWDTVMADHLARGRGDPVTGARFEFDYCQRAVDGFSHYSMRRCIDQRHDDLIRGVNTTYWRQQPGS